MTSIQYCFDSYVYIYIYMCFLIYYSSLMCFVFCVILYFFWIYNFSRSKGFSYLFWNL